MNETKAVPTSCLPPFVGRAWLLPLLVIVLVGATSLHTPAVIWSGAAGADTNWSNSLNWTGGAPAGNDVLFYDPGAVSAISNLNNVVDSSTTILSLQYGNTNNFHTTRINPGVTLTVSNPAAGNLVFVGTGTGFNASQTVTATVTGAGGALAVAGPHSGSVMQIQQGAVNAGSHVASLDRSGLDTFTLAAGRLLVGGNPGTGASNLVTGTLNLAKTTLIELHGTTAPVLNVGDAASNGAGSANTNSLQLGQTNALFADTLAIGRSKSVGALRFNPALAGRRTARYQRGPTT